MYEVYHILEASREPAVRALPLREMFLCFRSDNLASSFLIRVGQVEWCISRYELKWKPRMVICVFVDGVKKGCVKEFDRMS